MSYAASSTRPGVSVSKTAGRGAPLLLWSLRSGLTPAGLFGGRGFIREH